MGELFTGPLVGKGEDNLWDLCMLHVWRLSELSPSDLINTYFDSTHLLALDDKNI